MIVQVRSYNAMVRSAPKCLLSMPSLSRSVGLSRTCDTGSWCWWLRRASVAGVTAADFCGENASCISHTKKQTWEQRLGWGWTLLHFTDTVMLSLCMCLHDRAFLPCVFAGDFSASADGGNECHRSHMDMASLRYEWEREHEGEQPVQRGHVSLTNVFFYICEIDCNSKHLPAQI